MTSSVETQSSFMTDHPLKRYLWQVVRSQCYGFVVFDDPWLALAAPRGNASLGKHIREHFQTYNQAERTHRLAEGVRFEFCEPSRDLEAGQVDQDTFFIQLQRADARHLARNLAPTILNAIVMTS